MAPPRGVAWRGRAWRGSRAVESVDGLSFEYHSTHLDSTRRTRLRHRRADERTDRRTETGTVWLLHAKAHIRALQGITIPPSSPVWLPGDVEGPRNTLTRNRTRTRNTSLFCRCAVQSSSLLPRLASPRLALHSHSTATQIRSTTIRTALHRDAGPFFNSRAAHATCRSHKARALCPRHAPRRHRLPRRRPLRPSRHRRRHSEGDRRRHGQRINNRLKWPTVLVHTTTQIETSRLRRRTIPPVTVREPSLVHICRLRRGHARRRSQRPISRNVEKHSRKTTTRRYWSPVIRPTNPRRLCLYAWELAEGRWKMIARVIWSSPQGGTGGRALLCLKEVSQ